MKQKKKRMGKFLEKKEKINKFCFSFLPQMWFVRKSLIARFFLFTKLLLAGH